MGERTVLAWVDLETTGLDKENGSILELALVLTDLELNELDAYESIVPQDVPDALDNMDDYVKNMHTGNGLINELVRAGDASYADSLSSIEQEVLNRLACVRISVTDYEEKVIFVIAGSTVGFDKGWIEKDMPRLFEKLHYRQLDVSSYKVGFPLTFGTATSDAHRAMPDIRASIEIHRKMRELVQLGMDHKLGTNCYRRSGDPRPSTIV